MRGVLSLCVGVRGARVVERMLEVHGGGGDDDDDDGKDDGGGDDDDDDDGVGSGICRCLVFGSV